MAKKKLSEKTRQFYRGPACKPKIVANEEEADLIKCVIKECFPYRRNTFVIRTKNNTKYIKMNIGLSSSLRSLKQTRSKLVIYDDTAGIHLSNYLNYYGSKLNIPVIQMHGLIDIAIDIKLKVMLIVTFVEAEPCNDAISEVEVLTRMFEVMETKCKPLSMLDLKQPVVDNVVCSDKSQKKKKAKKDRLERSKLVKVELAIENT